MARAYQCEMEAWVCDWLRRNTEASVVNQQFHDDFHEAFGGTRKETYWGAQPVGKAMRVLGSLAKQRRVVVRTVGLGANWQPGFPKWVRSYSLE